MTGASSLGWSGRAYIQRHGLVVFLSTSPLVSIDAVGRRRSRDPQPAPPPIDRRALPERREGHERAQIAGVGAPVRRRRLRY